MTPLFFWIIMTLYYDQAKTTGQGEQENHGNGFAVDYPSHTCCG